MRGTTRLAARLLYNCWITELGSCFTLLPLDLYRELDVRANGSGMEVELTAKLLRRGIRRGIRPCAIPVSLRSAGHDERAKPTWRDGVAALWILTRVRVRRT
ncbi:MAG: hypothetical protein M3N21_06450 [Actinomycetota bacterium]|nr:hypothetical protein [Actinomycetota bacterium]